MPKNVGRIYTPAYQVVTETAAILQIGPETVHEVLIRELNRNRIRMRGEIRQQSGERLDLNHPKRLKKGPPPGPAVPRDLFLSGMEIMPSFYGRSALKFPALCDEWSNIYYGPTGARCFTHVIVNAHVLDTDKDKVLNETFGWASSGGRGGARRADALWGRVILHLVELGERKAYGHFCSTKTLVDSVCDKHEDISPESIQGVLDYVVQHMKQPTSSSPDSDRS